MKRLLGKITDIVPELMKMDMNALYEVDVKTPRSKRSIEQNRLLWKLVHKIARKVGSNDNDVYCGLLERADAKSDYIMATEEAEQGLRKCFRGVKFIRYQTYNGKTFAVYKVYLGSSTMDTKEMNELLEEAFNVCGEYGISTLEDYYG